MNRLVFALARLNDPVFVWVDLQPRQESLDPDSPTALGWIPAPRLFAIQTPEEGGPLAEPTGGPAAGVRSSFRRLPAVAQRAVEARRREGGGSMVVAFPNSDYVRRFYGEDPGVIRPLVAAFREMDISALFASVAAPQSSRQAFDFVLEARAESRARWENGSLVCEAAPRWSPLLRGESFPLRAVPEFAAALA